MTIWEIDQRLEKVFYLPETDEAVDVETGEIFDKEYLDSLFNDRNEKLRNILCYIKALKGDLETVDKEYKRIRALKKRTDNRIKSLMAYVAFILKGEKWEALDKSCKASFRLSKDVVTIDTLADIPDEFFKTPHTESNLNKTLIKERIKAGESVAGVHLEDNNNLQVR